jgi:hypothetical protein
MSLLDLIKRERKARAAAATIGAYPARVLLWLDDDSAAECDAKLNAARAAGRVGPATDVTFVRWMTEAEAGAAQ